MPRNKTARYAMFGLLYFSQGTILSYFTALNSLYFRSKGLTMTDAGIFATIALLPFVIKIFLGMLSDRVSLFGMGHRKPYIMLGLLIQFTCLVIAPFIDPAISYWGFAALAFVLQLGMALYDTCTDGLALDTTPEEEQGTIQGFMVGGRALGVIITASVVGLLAQNVSWASVFWLLAALTVLPIPFVIQVHEDIQTHERKFEWQAFKAFKNKSVIALSAVGFIFFMVIAGANQLVNPFLQEEFQISLSMAGMMTTVWGIGVILGSVLGGSLFKRIGKQKGVLVALAISFVSVMLLSLIPNSGLAWGLVALFGVSYGSYQTIYFALSMNYTDPRIAASMFSILMAVTNVAQGIGMTFGGLISDNFGFRWAFVALALLNFIALPIIPSIFSQKSDSAKLSAA